ncbi:type II secretion protein F [Cellulomonas alba]|uniref:Type II secretion protein F n=1 Tax=Cellulomonas alba TaxID=3053467 RepID=A0ABT7SE50_9CELL|nr:type II secretion protein F [Cellulomonas alba]MDM7854468.1 type II secretion protein F [Cellulomonas alba]
MPAPSSGAAWIVGLSSGMAALAATSPRARLPPGGAGDGDAPAPVVSRDLAGALHAAAAQLRAGADPPAAWEQVLGARPDGRAALERLLLERCGGARRARRWRVAASTARAAGGPTAGVGRAHTAAVVRTPTAAVVRADTATAARVRAAVAAVEVAAELGAPLAPVLERIAGSVALDEEAAADLHAALAGPQATARLLAWLPALGLVLGVALGVDPVRVLLGGGLGTWAGAAGLALTVAGRRWTRRLVRAAAAGAGR